MEPVDFWRFLERSGAETDNLADVPAVLALARRRPGEWADAEWPAYEGLAAVAGRAYDLRTGVEDSLEDALDARGHRRYSDPHPNDRPWNDNDLAEIERRLPRLAKLFPRRRHLSTFGVAAAYRRRYRGGITRGRCGSR